jgi:tRNA modification GTPase
LAETPRGVLRIGRIGHRSGDEVVAAVSDGDLPAVEIQCHGGAAAVAMVVEALEAAGALCADDSELYARQAGDPLSAKSLVDLVSAPTLKCAEILLDQAQGALRGELIGISRAIDEDPDRALAGLDALISRGRIGLRLLSGWRVVIAGRPNVGKSRLFNTLAGFARAIVHPTPGTTRDVISQRCSFGGWPVELADTAGLREALDPIESIGVERSRREHQEADLVLSVLDRSLRLEPIDHELITANRGAILVANKSDLSAVWSDCDYADLGAPILTVSAQTGDGIARLIEEITRRLVPEPPLPGAAVPFRIDQLDDLTAIRGCLLTRDRAAAALRLAALTGGPALPRADG